MIAADDRLELPGGVKIVDDRLVDEVRELAIPLNDTARVTLSCTTVSDAARELATRYAIDEARARDDAVSFVRQLNAHALVNVRPGLGAAALLTRWVLALAVLLPRGLVPTLPAGRRRIDTSTTMRLLSTSSRALAPVAAVYAATAFAITVVAVTPLGVDTALAAAAACATGAGVWLHELGHAAALRRVPSCVVVRGLRVAVLHRPVGTGHTRAVAAAGPVVGVAAAAITAFIATSPEGATAAGVLGTQSLGFTVLTSDGRRLCGLR